MKLAERERKIDISQLSTKEVDNLSKQISDKALAICEDAAKEVNKILAVYGMSAKISLVFNELQQQPEQAPKARNKRAKKV